MDSPQQIAGRTGWQNDYTREFGPIPSRHIANTALKFYNSSRIRDTPVTYLSRSE